MAKAPDLTPPDAVAHQAERGLRLYGTFGRCGTEAGWARARQLSARRELSREDVVAMASCFARHAVDKSWRRDDDPSAGYVAWLLWGGEPGKEWAERTKAVLGEGGGQVTSVAA